MDNLPVPEIKKEPLPTVATRDYVFLVIFFALSLLLSHVSFALFGLGWAISISLLLAASLVYLKGKLQFSALSYISLISTFIIAASFFVHGENNFAVLKFLFLIFSISVFFVSAGGFSSRRIDCFGIIFAPLSLVFNVGLINAPKVARACIKKDSGIGSKIAKIALALICVFPLAAVIVVLLAWSDAAFEGFVDAFDFDIDELLRTLIWAILYFAVVFPIVFVINKKMFKEREATASSRRGIDSLFVNTVLSVVSIIYLLFIITQFSYIFNSFAGLLPKDFTYSEYARRGFGEMCVICIINFAIIAISMAITARNENGELPFATRLLSVFISGFSIFLVIVAIAKMFMYIRNYGLTFLRLGTSIFMLLLFVVFAAMIIKTFKPQFLHIRVIVAAACIIMGITAIFEPYAVIASYNTYAYESGMHDSIDLWYLQYECGAYGLPKMIELTEDDNVYVADKAKEYLEHFRVRENYTGKIDWREFSVSNYIARQKLAEYKSGK
ncbi:MAG: DUF4173 domain-containing protein [Ruminococcaceae bacterium]|nr:DUF4173 domain-containing protein [Oscillospiraceae bacterium]